MKDKETLNESSGDRISTLSQSTKQYHILRQIFNFFHIF